MENNQEGTEGVNEPVSEQAGHSSELGSIDTGESETAGKPGIWDYYKMAWQDYANFRERASRAEFWYFTLVDFILFIVVYGLVYLLPDSVAAFLGLLIIVYAIASFIPRLALTVRRLHDINKSGANIFWGVIPIIGPIILLVYYIRPGDKQANDYGPVPKQ